MWKLWRSCKKCLLQAQSSWPKLSGMNPFLSKRWIHSFGAAGLIVVVQSTSGFAAQTQAVSPCGVFKVEGLLRESPQYPKYLELVTDQNSRSERRIVLGKMSADELKSIQDLRVAGKLRLYHFCVGDCFGEWLGTDRMLGPTEKPHSFAAAPASIRVKTEECLTFEESKKRVVR